MPSTSSSYVSFSCLIPFFFFSQESFSKEKQRLLSTQASIQGSTNDPNSVVSLPPDSQLWKQIVGEKKGRVYGMGSQAHTMWSAVHDTGGSSSQIEISEMKQQMRTLQDSVNFLILQLGARQLSPMQQPPMPYPPWMPPPPSQVPPPTIPNACPTASNASPTIPDASPTLLSLDAASSWTILDAASSWTIPNPNISLDATTISNYLAILSLSRRAITDTATGSKPYTWKCCWGRWWWRGRFGTFSMSFMTFNKFC